MQAHYANWLRTMLPAMAALPEDEVKKLAVITPESAARFELRYEEQPEVRR